MKRCLDGLRLKGRLTAGGIDDSIDAGLDGWVDGWASDWLAGRIVGP